MNAIVGLLSSIIVPCILWALYERRKRLGALQLQEEWTTNLVNHANVATKLQYESEADAGRLAAIVRDYIRMIDETAKLLKDEQPPALALERHALSLHEKLVSSRNDPVVPHQS